MKSGTEYLPGDHLKVGFRWYQHHGISLGDGRVVHFGRGVFDSENACVEIVSEEVFSAGRPVEVVASPCHFDRATVVQRALGRVGERGYELFENNCEHFVRWCRSDESTSLQASVFETLLRQSVAAGMRVTIGKQLVAASIIKLPTSLARASTKIALAADAAQAATELVATTAGCKEKTSKRIGKQVGFGSSATLGFAVGGPAGAAFSAGYWAVGQAIGQAVVAKTQDTIKNVTTR